MFIIIKNIIISLQTKLLYRIKYIYYNSKKVNRSTIAVHDVRKQKYFCFKNITKLNT